MRHAVVCLVVLAGIAGATVPAQEKAPLAEANPFQGKIVVVQTTMPWIGNECLQGVKLQKIGDATFLVGTPAQDEDGNQQAAPESTVFVGTSNSNFSITLERGA